MSCYRLLVLLAALLPAVSCQRSLSPDLSEDGSASRPWQLMLTKSGVRVDEEATYRASLLHNIDGTLRADGSYSGYYKPAGWLYPCRADAATGKAVDKSDGSTLLDWDDPSWFDKTDTSSVYGLRGPANHAYTFILARPAVRMQPFWPSSVEPEDRIPANNAQRHWGYALTRRVAAGDELYISEPVEDLGLYTTWLGTNETYNYIYPVDAVLYDRRAKLTVKVSCRGIPASYLHAVYFKNVISSAWYMPKTKAFEEYILDGGEVTEENALANYYTAAEKMILSPDVYLVKGDEPYTTITDFPILSLNYAALDGDVYRFADIIPEIVVLTGEGGNIRTVVTLAANILPMKEYTVHIYLSTAFVQAILTVDDWADGASIDDISFGSYVELGASSTLTVSDWTDNGTLNGNVGS